MSHTPTILIATNGHEDLYHKTITVCHYDKSEAAKELVEFLEQFSPKLVDEVGIASKILANKRKNDYDENLTQAH